MEIQLGSLHGQKKLEDLVVVHQGFISQDEVKRPGHGVLEAQALPPDLTLARETDDDLDLSGDLFVVLHDAAAGREEGLVDVWWK